MRDAFGVSKGDYSDAIVRVQSHRQKANRRRTAGNVLLGGAAVAGSVAMVPDVAEVSGRYAGRKVSSLGFKQTVNAATTNSASSWAKRKTTKASLKSGGILMAAGKEISSHPRMAVAGAIGGVAAAGAGLRGAGMAHNAWSNKKAREYNANGKNSKIKIVPVAGKNRF